MRAVVAKDLSDSARDFVEIVWPVVSPWFGGGALIPVETVTDSGMARLMDMASGIDAWHHQEELGIRGIASRIQWETAWDTFTIRYSRTSGAKTEYEKRLSAIESDRGWIYPHLWVQAYVSKRQDGVLLSAAAMRTAGLIRLAQEVVDLPRSIAGLYGIRRTSNASFIFVDWDWAKLHGADIKIFRCS